MFNFKRLTILVILFAFTVGFLTGCASITRGTTQAVTVTTTPPNAYCGLSNDKGNWQISHTPATAYVTKAWSPLFVICSKGKGKSQLVGDVKVESTTTGMAFGNILAGGIIGASVDMSSGAAYDYPSEIHVELKP